MEEWQWLWSCRISSFRGCASSESVGALDLHTFSLKRHEIPALVARHSSRLQQVYHSTLVRCIAAKQQGIVLVVCKVPKACTGMDLLHAMLGRVQPNC